MLHQISGSKYILIVKLKILREHSHRPIPNALNIVPKQLKPWIVMDLEILNHVDASALHAN